MGILNPSISPGSSIPLPTAGKHTGLEKMKPPQEEKHFTRRIKFCSEENRLLFRGDWAAEYNQIYHEIQSQATLELVG